MRRIALALIGSTSIISPAFAIDTTLQWGVDRTVNPWTICAYDSTNTCQPIFSLPPTGGGASLPPSAMPALTGDVTSSAGSTATTIAPGVVTSSKMASGAAATNVGSLGGSLTGTLPNPTLAAGAASSNIGTLGGVLGGTLPNPTMAPGAASTNIGSLGGVLTGTLPNPGLASGAAITNMGNQSANSVLAGPTSGSPAAPAFRALGLTDIGGLGSGVAAVLGVTANGALGMPVLDSSGNASAFNVKALGSSIARTLAAQTADAFNVKNNGAVGNGSASDGTAVQATFTQAASGGTVYLPCGVYKVGQNITLSLANLAHLSIVGGGSDCTELWFSGGNFGATINWAGLYGSVSASGISITTDQVGPTTPGLSLVNSNTLGGSNNLTFGSNNFPDVVFRGHNTFSGGATEYWGTGFYDQSVSGVNFFGGSFNAGQSSPPAPNFGGTGYSINGTSSEDAIAVAFFGTETFNCNIGIFYGNYVQGVYGFAFQSTGCEIGASTGTQNEDSLVFQGSQFEDYQFGIKINNPNFNNLQVTGGNVFIINAGATGIQNQGVGNQIIGNSIGGASLTGTTGIITVANSGNASGTQINNNVIGNLGTGIAIDNGVTAAYNYANYNIFQPANTNDYVLGSGGSAGLFILDNKLRNLSNIIACSSAIYPSQFLQADSLATAWNGIAAGGGSSIMPILCDSLNYRNH